MLSHIGPGASSAMRFRRYRTTPIAMKALAGSMAAARRRCRGGAAKGSNRSVRGLVTGDEGDADGILGKPRFNGP
jgi:hypothetical protein